MQDAQVAPVLAWPLHRGSIVPAEDRARACAVLQPNITVGPYYRRRSISVGAAPSARTRSFLPCASFVLRA